LISEIFETPSGIVLAMELPPNPPTPGLGYYPASMPPQGSRPASISAISVTAIVLGSLGTLCGAFNIIVSIVMLLSSSASAAMTRSAQFQSTGFKAFAAAQALIITALYGTLLIGGIGGVQVREWARKLLIRWAVVMLVWVPLSVVVQSVLVAITPMQQMQQQFIRPGQPAPPFPAGTFKVVQIVSAVFGGAIQCVFPPFILVFWRRPNVGQAFEEPKPSF
jgi:hypothetical protein